MTLLIAIGNPLRGDDGVAERVLRLLDPADAVTLQSVHQLMPECACELMRSETVVFLDADPRVEEPHLEPVSPQPSRDKLLSHASTPAEVVSLAQQLFGFAGSAWLCRIPAREFEPGHRLSPLAEDAAHAAAQLLESQLGLASLALGVSR
jgi:hydrogenase maturation protease